MARSKFLTSLPPDLPWRALVVGCGDVGRWQRGNVQVLRRVCWDQIYGVIFAVNFGMVDGGTCPHSRADHSDSSLSDIHLLSQSFLKIGGNKMLFQIGEEVVNASQGSLLHIFHCAVPCLRVFPNIANIWLTTLGFLCCIMDPLKYLSTCSTYRANDSEIIHP